MKRPAGSGCRVTRRTGSFVRRRAGWSATLVVLMLAACEHPIGIVTPHIEAADLIVTDSTGVVLARTQYNRSWLPDSLVVTEGQPLRVTMTPVDFRGKLIDVSGRRDISFRMEAENTALFQWEPQRGYGWIRPFAPGETEARILIWHDTHADFVTPWLRLIVRPATGTSAPAPEVES
jgi:hypothetical protein